MTRPLVVLGATGSIGQQTLQVATHLGLEVAALAARSPSPSFADTVAAYPDARVVATGGTRDERVEFEQAVGSRAGFGMDALLELAGLPETIVVNGIVGSAGLRSTIVGLEAGNRVALANKESMVAGGTLVKEALATGGGELIPVDSEHSALYQCLLGEKLDTVARLMLTASGGPFRGRSREDLDAVTPEEALRHPTWDMGPRISIDSATMFNKGLEVIEAHHLFDIEYERIDVMVHPQSIVHSVVEFIDGSWKGHMGVTDMRIPIQFALSVPTRLPGMVPPFDLAGQVLTFEEPDRKAFPALDLAYEAGRMGGMAPAVLNAADEIAVEAFLDRRLGFNGITDLVTKTLENVPNQEVKTVEDVIEADREARAVASSLIASSC